jgi:hypothetical protein
VAASRAVENCWRPYYFFISKISRDTHQVKIAGAFSGTTQKRPAIANVRAQVAGRKKKFMKIWRVWRNLPRVATPRKFR